MNARHRGDGPAAGPAPVPIPDSVSGQRPRRRGCVVWAVVVLVLFVAGVAALVTAVVVYQRGNQELVLPPDGGPIPTSPPVTRPDSPVLVSRLDVTQGSNRRRAVLLSPPDVAPGERLPLVLLLHGHSGNSGVVVSEGGWKPALLAHRFHVLAPEGIGQSWNAGGCCRSATTLGIEDEAYLDALVDDLRRRPQVDPDRVAIVGNSNGGMMAYRYACRHAGKLSGIVSVQGTNVAGCSPSEPLSVLHVAGTADRVVPYEGGRSAASVLLGSGRFPAVEPSLSTVAGAAGCGEDPTVAEESAAVSTRTWSGCRDEVQVRLDVIDGQGHAWPRGAAYDATERAVSFLGLAGG